MVWVLAHLVLGLGFVRIKEAINVIGNVLWVFGLVSHGIGNFHVEFLLESDHHFHHVQTIQAELGKGGGQGEFSLIDFVKVFEDRQDALFRLMLRGS